MNRQTEHKFDAKRNPSDKMNLNLFLHHQSVQIVHKTFSRALYFSVYPKCTHVFIQTNAVLCKSDRLERNKNA